MSSGSDHIDAWGAFAGDPLVTYSRGINARSVAEWAIGAILHFYRHFNHYSHAMHGASWIRHWGRELSDQRLVVLGAGAAGSELARIAKAFEMKTVGISRSGTPLPGFDQVIPTSETYRVWGTGDVTVVFLPLTTETRGSVGAAEIAALSPGSILVVASRGGIVDEKSVLDAVQAGHLAGAAIDVFETEPLPPQSPLWHEPRILVTPHVAGTTDRFMQRTCVILTRIWNLWQLERDTEALAYYRYYT